MSERESPKKIKLCEFIQFHDWFQMLQSITGDHLCMENTKYSARICRACFQIQWIAERIILTFRSDFNMIIFVHLSSGYLLKSMFISLLLIMSVTLWMSIILVVLWQIKYGKCSKNMFCFYEMLINACSYCHGTDFVKVVPELLYIALI